MSRSDWIALAWLADYMLWMGAFALLLAGAIEFWRWAWPRFKKWWSEPFTVTITTTTTKWDDE